MGHPIPPSTSVLMVALAELKQYTQATPLPPVHPGHSFWANSRQQDSLIQGGLARLWHAGDPPAPPAEPAYTANWIPGIARGVTNASH
jgi:hypothetical protein